MLPNQLWLLVLSSRYKGGYGRTSLRSKTAKLPGDPTQLFVVLWTARGIAELAVGVIFVNKVEQDGSTVKHTLSAVGNGGDLSIGVDFQERPMFIFILARHE